MPPPAADVDMTRAKEAEPMVEAGIPETNDKPETVEVALSILSQNQ